MNKHELDTALRRLGILLERRASVVGDRKLLQESPAEHLRQLREASHELFEAHRELAEILPPRLHHFLTNGSYAKASEFIATRGQ